VYDVVPDVYRLQDCSQLLLYLQPFPACDDYVVVMLKVKEEVLALIATLCVHCYSYDLNALLQQQKLNESYEQSAAYLRYTQEATEVIKNAVGVHHFSYSILYAWHFCFCSSWFMVTC